MAEMLSVLMQRSDPAFPWGFSIKFNEVADVTSGTLAALHLAPGDKILEINKMKTRKMTQDEIEAFLNGSSKTLDLLIIKTPDIRSETSSAHRNRSESQDSWDSGLARSTLKPSKQISKQSELNEGFKSSPDTYQRSVHSPSSSPVKKRDSRYDQWVQNPEKIFRKYNSDQAKIKTQSKKGYHNEESGHLKTCEEEDYPRRTPKSSDYIDPNQMSKGNDKYTTSGKQRNQSVFWDCPERRGYNESTDSKNRNRRSLNLEDLRKSGFNVNTEIPGIFTKNPYQPQLNRRFTITNDDSVIDPEYSFGSKPNDHSRRAWLDTFLSGSTSNTRLSQSEFKKSVTTVNETFSSYDGVNESEKHEHLNVRKETEERVKIVDGNKEEVTKKTSKNQEYSLTNKDTKNGYSNESKKTINDHSIAESVSINGKQEFSNKITNRSEDAQDSLPVHSSRVQEKNNRGDLIENPSAHQPEYCDQSFVRDNEGGCINSSYPASNHNDSSDEGSLCFSSVRKNGFSGNKYGDRATSNDRTSSNIDVLEQRNRTPVSSYNQQPVERQSDITFWEFSPESNPSNSISSTSNRENKRNNSDFSHGYSSLTSECSSLPDLRSNELTPDMRKAILKRPKDFLIKEYKEHCQVGKIKIPSAFSKNSGITAEHDSSDCVSVMKRSSSVMEEANPRKTLKHIDRSNEVRGETNTCMENKTGNIWKDIKKHEYDLDSNTNGESSKIRTCINEFEVADKISNGENKKYLDFVKRSKETLHPSYSNLKDDIEDCAFKCPLNDEFDSGLKWQSNSNHNIRENKIMNNPTFSEDQLSVRKHNIEHSSDYEDDVFLTSPSISPITNEVTVLNSGISGTNSTLHGDRKHSPPENIKLANILEDSLHHQERPTVIEGNVLAETASIHCPVDPEIGLSRQHGGNTSPAKVEPFKFWKDQESQKHMLQLITPKPFVGHSNNTTIVISSSLDTKE